MTNQDTQASPDPLDLKTLQAENDSLRAELDQLAAELTAAQAESPGALKELAARAQADLQNAKERLERESQDMRRFAVANLLLDLLPVVDNFRRAFAHLPPELAKNEWVKGVEAVEKDFMKTLSGHGLAPITALGEQLDAAKHEVLQAGPGEKDKVIEVYEDGYELNGKILRPAKVKVGDGTAIV